jgi:hypothetical protein
MSGGMVFRKDCEDCGRSFLTPDRNTRLCTRCAVRRQKRDDRVRITTEEHPSKTTAPKASIEKQRLSKPADNLNPQVAKEEDIPRKPEVSKTIAAQIPEMTKPEIELTKAQEQKIIERYQAYVLGMERPPKGRRKAIAAQMGLSYRTVVLAVRHWNQRQSQGKDSSRDDLFSVEKAYFSFLKMENSFSQLKERITQETSLSSWAVSRYLDLLHDGEDRLREVPDVSPERRTAILAEYHKYLSGLTPPRSPLHALIAERIEVTPKQVHKVLAAYRLGLFRERWS